MTIYLLVAQAPELITRLVVEKIPLRWVIRTTGRPTALASAVREALLTVDSTPPPTDVVAMTEVLDRSIAGSRFNMLMLAALGVLALTLAAIGIYGLTAYAVVQRTRGIGIRVSLGVRPAQIVRELVTHALGLCLAGAGVGVARAVLLRRLLRGLLFGISPADMVTITTVTVTMTVVVAIATYLPALRAAPAGSGASAAAGIAGLGARRPSTGRRAETVER